ncbi:MAG TPA: hypothetical protein VHM90_03920, partial [Phycisphaerae bacterium]|nr:hypothetical protein [Phycisphaerae bacterium]
MKFNARRSVLIAGVLTFAVTAVAQVSQPAGEPAAQTPAGDGRGGGGFGGGGAGGAGGAGRAGGGVPSDLKPLLLAKPSEMRLVTERYDADRSLLGRFYEIPTNRNLLGGGGGGGGGNGRGGAGGGRGAGATTEPTEAPDTQNAGGRGGAPQLDPPLALEPEPQARGGGRGGRGGAGGAGAGEGFSPSIATARIARLKRFDLDWSAALSKIDASKLSPQAQTDLQNLENTVQANLRALDAQAAVQAQVMPLLPFAQSFIQLEESRRKMESMDAEKSAVTLMNATKQIAEFQKKLEAGLADPAKLGDVKFSKLTATRAAAVVDGLQSTLRDWFAFYNDYDPMFTWWMPQPNKEADAALASYANFL